MQHSESDRTQRKSYGKQHTRRCESGELPRHGGAHEREERDWQEAQSGLDRRIAEEVLQVEGQVQEHREDRGRQREGRDLCAAERRLSEEGEVDHRITSSPLRRYEDGEQRKSAEEHCEDQRARPAFVVAAQQRKDEREERAAQGQQSDDVDTAVFFVTRLTESQHGDGSRSDSDRNIHEEDPAP